MANWAKVGTDAVVGGALGIGDQIFQNQDEKRGLEARAAGTLAADKKLPIMGQIGTYYNYGIPILAILATAMGWLRGDMSTRLVTAGAELAGRKATHYMTTGKDSPLPSAAYTEWRRQEAARAAADARARSARYEVTDANQILV